MIKMNANHMFFFCSHLFVPSENNQSKKSVLLRGAEVFCVIEIVSAQIQARCAQLSCCNTTTQSAAASGAHEHFWHVVIPPDMVGKLIFHRSRKGNDKETNQFFVFVYWNNRLLFQLRPSAAVKKAYRICHRTLLSLYIYYQAVKTQTCLRGKQCTFFLKWSLRSCIHVSELLPLGVCVTKFDTEYFELVISFFLCFLHLCCWAALPVQFLHWISQIS